MLTASKPRRYGGHTVPLGDIGTVIQRAFEFVWVDHLKRRAEGRDFRGDTYYVTASTLQGRIRAAAYEKVEGLPVGELGAWCSYPNATTIKGLEGTSLLNWCRAWLHKQVDGGVLETDNDRCSTRARFRPKGAELNKSEQVRQALPEEEQRRRRWIVHLKNAEGKASCSAGKRKPAMYRRSQTHSSDKAEQVTCKSCIKLIAAQAQA